MYSVTVNPKGLGCPIGSVLVGDEDLMKNAIRIRKVFGGNMRQVGYLAAAGLYALKHNISRLSEDHEKARRLAEIISKTEQFKIDLQNVQTNIIIFRPTNSTVEEVIRKCSEQGLLLSTGQVGTLRAVTHMDVSVEDIESAGSIIEKLFN